MASTSPPAAFLSYVRLEDSADNTPISHFARTLAAEVHTVTGRPFTIFQDRNDISVGQQWRDRIESSIDSATLLIAILTPLFFNSEYCRKEVEQFLEREKALGRNDLIVPVYYVTVDGLEERVDQDPGDPNRFRMIQVIRARQYCDWRPWRFAQPVAPELLRAINALAMQIKATLDRPTRNPSKLSSPPRPASKDENGEDTPTLAPTPEQTTQTSAVAIEGMGGSEPPTHIVDSMRGPFKTVGDAVATAAAADRIRIRPGTYDGSVVLDKPLEIIGDDAEQVVVQASGANALVFRTTLGRVTNITLRQLGGGEYFAVDVGQGQLTLEGCDIESESLSGIAVHGPDAAPIIRNNRIHHCVKSGVVLFGHARATLEKNHISHNGIFGVAIQDAAGPVLRSNEIHDNVHGGVYCDGSHGRIEGNSIFSNRAEGVLVSNGGDPELLHNKIFKNDKAGVYVYDRGRPSVKQNTIVENGNSGIAIRTEGDPVIQENAVNGNNGKGIWCDDHAAGVAENNDLRHNKFGAFWKSDNSVTRYVGNRE